MSTEIELVPFALSAGSGVMVCCVDDAQAIIAQRDARIAELEAERARWERLAQKAWDKCDAEFAADIATAIRRSAGVRIPDPEEWLASGEQKEVN